MNIPCTSEILVQYMCSGHEFFGHVQSVCVWLCVQCAEEEATRSLVREHEGLEPLALLLKNSGNKELLCAVTGAVWKCSKSAQNVAKYAATGTCAVYHKL